MENLIFAFFVALIVAFMTSNIFAILYNLFIGLPLGYKIAKEKKYKTVTATQIIYGGNGFTEVMNGDNSGNHKNIFQYEWEVDGKRYNRTIHTSYWPSSVDTFYYLDNPKYAMPNPKELARFKHTFKLFLIIFIIVFFIVLKGH